MEQKTLRFRVQDLVILDDAPWPGGWGRQPLLDIFGTPDKCPNPYKTLAKPRKTYVFTAFGTPKKYINPYESLVKLRKRGSSQLLEHPKSIQTLINP